MAETAMSVIMETVMSIRTIRGELNLSPSLELKAHIKTLSDTALTVLNENQQYLKKLARADIIKTGAEVTKPAGSAVAVRNYTEVYIPLEGLLNVDLEIERLKKEDAKLDQDLIFLNKKLLNEDFVSRAPKEIVEKEKEKYNNFLKKKEKIQDNINKLYEMGAKE